MKLIITSCFVNSSICAPVVFVTDPADPALRPETASRRSLWSLVEPDASAEGMQSGAYCCTDCLRKALSRHCCAVSQREASHCVLLPHRPASRPFKHARSVRKRARAQRLQLRNGAVPASLKRPRVFRLSPVTAETDAPYPLDSDTFKASLAQALDRLKTEPQEIGAGHEVGQEVSQVVSQVANQVANQDTVHDKGRGKGRRKNKIIGK